MTSPSDIGPIGGLPPGQVVRAAGLVRQGRTFSLAAVRYPGMPLFPGHPPFQVLNYRTPRGIRVTGAQPWGPVNDAGLGYMAEYVMATSHSGAHMDALAHMTVGDDMRWYGGGNADQHLTDFGPTHLDASAMPPFFTRGVLLDAAGHRGLDCLPAGAPIDAAEMEAICVAQGVTVGPWDVVLIRTGYMGLWPDAGRMAAHKTPGPDISAARWLLERGVVATLGPTFEPYLSAFPLPDEFFPLLMTGRIGLAETYWRTCPFTSWAMVLVCDPLYNPFKNKPAFPEKELPERMRAKLFPPTAK